jgi:DNA-binding NarL/FixJ family response regulator
MAGTKKHKSGDQQRVLIIDDHRTFRDALAAFFTLRTPPIEVVGCAADARSALGLIESTKPDIVVVDLFLPEIGGILATREIVKRWPGIAVLVLTADDRIERAREALDAGALGFALKHSGADEIARAVEAVSRGERYVTPALRDWLDDADQSGTGAL